MKKPSKIVSVNRCKTIHVVDNLPVEDFLKALNEFKKEYPRANDGNISISFENRYDHEFRPNSFCQLMFLSFQDVFENEHYTEELKAYNIHIQENNKSELEKELRLLKEKEFNVKLEVARVAKKEWKAQQKIKRILNSPNNT